jgi:Family of unknown function (DUF5989)
MNDPESNEFEKAAAEGARPGLLRDLWGFLRENKKWWLLPIIAVLLLFGLLIIMSGTALAPFIYTLF